MILPPPPPPPRRSSWLHLKHPTLKILLVISTVFQAFCIGCQARFWSPGGVLVNGPHLQWAHREAVSRRYWIWPESTILHKRRSPFLGPVSLIQHSFIPILTISKELFLIRHSKFGTENSLSFLLILSLIVTDYIFI